MGFRTHAVVIAPAFEGTETDLLRHLGVTARPVGTERMTEAWYPAHLAVGRLGGCSVVFDHLLVDLLLRREAGIERAMTTWFADRRVLALHVDDDALVAAWVLWAHGTLRRVRVGSARDGVRVDEGTWLQAERRWPLLVDPGRPRDGRPVRHGGLRWVDPAGRIRSQAQMGPRWARWISAELLGAPIDTHPELAEARVQRFVEQPMREDERRAVVERTTLGPSEDAPLPAWLRRALGR